MKTLVIEDDLGVAELLCRILGNFGFQAEVALGGGLGKMTLEERGGEFKLVAILLETRSGNVADIIAYCHEHTEAKIVLISNTFHAGMDLKKTAREYGADGAFPKPFQPTLTREALVDTGLIS